ncbi:TnsA-like heteromeric transposase endonuclease subunit [Antrihabitans cavernicola]|uniref:TnsA-like heteromeric transposase endonuclease subunit n=1 Tax=Antrihabitans cavernicola TaxID=2495913 RepID=A0A5A7S6E0_9NOCA|nr:TnsA-like heteromeric transposase endonuclease subunit [Spelaeibacter cavernicola]
MTFCDDGGEQSDVLARVHHRPFESGRPVRALRTYKGQRNFVGEWWSATTGDHVGFESWVERDRLMELDFVRESVGIASQPFRLGLRVGERAVAHTPDYFVRCGDGTGWVVDVRPDALVGEHDAAVFAATGRCCEAAGWRYTRVGELDPVFAANLRWLAGYRHRRCLDSAIAAVVAEVLAAAPMPIGTLAERCGPPIVVLPTIFHLIWIHRIATDLGSVPLSLASVVRGRSAA